MAELESHVGSHTPDDSNASRSNDDVSTSTSDVSFAGRRPRRRVSVDAGAPSIEAPPPNPTPHAKLRPISDSAATVVSDAQPVSFRERRRAARAARQEVRESGTGEAAELSRSTPVPEAPPTHVEPAPQPEVIEPEPAPEAHGDAAVVLDDLKALASERQDDISMGPSPEESAQAFASQDFASVLFQAPVTGSEPSDAVIEDVDDFHHVTTFVSFDAPDLEAVRERSTLRDELGSDAASGDGDEDSDDDSEASDADGDDFESRSSRRRRRGGRGRRGRGRSEDDASEQEARSADTPDEDDSSAETADDDAEATSSSRRRRRRRRSSGSAAEDVSSDDPPNTVVRVREGRDEVKAVKGSTRLEAKKQRRKEGRESGRRRHSITESEFLARRESVKRSMIVRERPGRTQIVVLEDNILVEHYVAQKSHTSMVGNVYLGKVQNVLPSMEAAFVDIGKGRNAVLYAGEVNWDAAGLDGQPRRIELALKPGDSVLVQATKDPIGHKGARLTSQISLPGRFLVYVPGGSMTGISRKLPDNERARLKKILKQIVPEEAGVIVRTAAEGASEEELTRDVERLQKQWAKIDKASKTKSAPAALSTEPNLAIKVVRDIFNEDFTSLIVEGEAVYKELHSYIADVAPDLLDRVTKHVGTKDSFQKYRIDEQLMKAMDRKVYLPSGGSLVIDRTEAMTVVDVNTGKFTGSGGSLEETVTRNNLEAAEEIVRQLRLRDIGGIIVVDFIDMVLESNRDLVLRRMIECLSRDRTKHQVAEVTSLGLVQMTRKRVGAGLVETFSSTCEHCNGRGITIDFDGQLHVEPPAFEDETSRKSRRRSRRSKTESPDSRENASSQGRTARGEDSPASHEDSARDAVRELVDSKHSGDVHRLDEDEKARALAAATIASIAAASTGDSHPEVTVDSQVISVDDERTGDDSTPSVDEEPEQLKHST